MDFAVCFFLPCVFVVAHGKISLCRVPDKKHMAKTEAHGKLAISRSVPLRQMEVYVKGQATNYPDIKLLSRRVMWWIGTCEYIARLSRDGEEV